MSIEALSSSSWVKRNLGFVLGLICLCIFSIGLAIAVDGGGRGTSWLASFSVWSLYLGYSGPSQHRTLGRRVIPAIIVLILLTGFVWSFNSVSHVQSQVVNVTRSFSASHSSITLVLTYDLYSTLGPFPVMFPETSFNLVHSKVGVIATGDLNGGTIYPLQHLTRTLTFVIPFQYVNLYSGNSSEIHVTVNGSDGPVMQSFLWDRPVAELLLDPTNGSWSWTG